MAVLELDTSVHELAAEIETVIETMNSTIREHFIDVVKESVIESALSGDRDAYRILQSQGIELLRAAIIGSQDAAAALAAAWYDYERDRAGIGGSWSGANVSTPTFNPYDILAGVNVTSADPMSWADNLLGGAELRVTDAANSTIMSNAFRDPQAGRWERIAEPGACAYCAMLASRGFVYRTQETATFAPHTHCRCFASASWNGVQVRVNTNYTPSARFKGATPQEQEKLDRQRAQQNRQARAWMRDNKQRLGLLNGNL